MKKVLSSLLLISCAASAAFADNENYDGQDVSGQQFISTSLKNSSWVNATAKRCSFRNTDITGADFTNADLSGSEFRYTNKSLATANFTNAIINGCIFSDFDYSPQNAILQDQLYSTKSYKDKNLSGIGLAYSRSQGWDFSGQNLSGANFTSAEMNGCNLSGANLTNAIFFSTVLYNSNCTAADFRGADLTNTMFNDRHLYLATLTNSIGNLGVINSFSMTSASDTLLIRKYTGIDASINYNASISGGASITLDPGAFFNITTSKKLTLADSSSLIFNVNEADGAGLMRVTSGSSFELQLGGEIVIQIDWDFSNPLDAPLEFTVIEIATGATFVNSENFNKDSVQVFLNENIFKGDWEIRAENGEYGIKITNIPEPSTYAAIFGALIFGFIIWRKRK